jgi:hypothetical protein
VNSGDTCEFEVTRVPNLKKKIIFEKQMAEVAQIVVYCIGTQYKFIYTTHKNFLSFVIGCCRNFGQSTAQSKEVLDKVSTEASL